MILLLVQLLLKVEYILLYYKRKVGTEAHVRVYYQQNIINL